MEGFICKDKHGLLALPVWIRPNSRDI